MNVVKDWWDKLGIIISVISLILIYYFGSYRSDNLKEKARQINILNHLSICIYNYTYYLFKLRKTLFRKQRELSKWLETGKNDVNIQPFFRIIEPMKNFDVKIEKYAFTVDVKPQIESFLIKYLYKYEELAIKVKNINTELSQAVANPNLKQTIAETYITKDGSINILENTIMAINEAIYRLYQISLEMYEYAKIKRITKEYAHILLNDSTVKLIEEIKNDLDKSKNTTDWHNDFDDKGIIRENKILVFLRNIFSVTNTTEKNKHKIVKILWIKFKFRYK